MQLFKSREASSTDATSLTDFSLLAWWQILKRTYSKQNAHNLSLVAAGVAFYFLLAVFPLLTAVISLYGLLVTPEQLQSHMAHLVDVVPADSRYIVEEQLTKLTGNSDFALSWGVSLSLLLTIWSSSKGANALITALCTGPETRALEGPLTREEPIEDDPDRVEVRAGIIA